MTSSVKKIGENYISILERKFNAPAEVVWEISKNTDVFKKAYNLDFNLDMYRSVSTVVDEYNNKEELRILHYKENFCIELRWRDDVLRFDFMKYINNTCIMSITEVFAGYGSYITHDIVKQNLLFDFIEEKITEVEVDKLKLEEEYTRKYTKLVEEARRS
ncbi:MAG: hypothetical protein ACK5LT_06190 [Lachnospirales bacterium]